MVHRGPQASPIQPTSGEPSGVPPMKIAMYSAITRPRICGSVLNCTEVLAEVMAVSEVKPAAASSTR